MSSKDLFSQVDLYVYLLGSPKLFRGGKEVTWNSRRQAGIILYYLILNRKRYITENELINILWPHPNDPKYFNRYRNSLRSNISHLIKILEPDHKPYQESTYIKKTQLGYKFEKGNTTQLDIDLFDYLYSQIEQTFLKSSFQEMESKLREILRIYKGPLLAGLENGTLGDDQWLIGNRASYWNKTLEIIIAFTLITAKTGNSKGAIELCHKYLEDEPDSPVIIGCLLHVSRIILDEINAQKYSAKLINCLNSLEVNKLGDIFHISTNSFLFNHPLRDWVEPLLQLSTTNIITFMSGLAYEKENPRPKIFNLPKLSDIYIGHEKTFTEALSFLKSAQRFLIISGEPGYGTSSFLVALCNKTINIFSNIIWVDLNIAIPTEDSFLSILAERFECAPIQDLIVEKINSLSFPSLLVFDNLYYEFLLTPIINVCSRLLKEIKIIVVSPIDLYFAFENCKNIYVNKISFEDVTALFTQVISPYHFEDILIHRICEQLDYTPSWILTVAEKAKILPLSRISEDLDKFKIIKEKNSIQTLLSQLKTNEVDVLGIILSFPETTSLHAIESITQHSNIYEILASLLKYKLIRFEGNYYSASKLTKKVFSLYYPDLSERCFLRVVDYITLITENNKNNLGNLILERKSIEGVLDWSFLLKKDLVFFRIGRIYSDLLKYIGESEARVIFLKKCVEMGRLAKDYFQYARFQNILGEALSSLGDHTNATNIALDALNIQIKRHNEYGIASNYGLLSLINYRIGNYTLALEYSDKSMELWEKVNDLKGIVRAYRMRAKILFRLGNLEKAINYLEQCLKICETAIRDKQEEIAQEFPSILSSLGEIFIQTRNLTMAREFYIRLITFVEQKGDNLGLAHGLLRITELFRIEGRLEEATKNCQMALEIFATLNHQGSLATCYNIYGNLFYDQGLFDKAAEQYYKALPIKEKMGDLHGAACSRLGLAKCFRHLGQNDRAKALAISTKQDFERLGNPYMIVQTEKLLERLNIQ